MSELISKYKTPLIITAAVLFAGAPVLGLVLPYIRKPTPRSTRPPRPLPKGVRRIASPEGLEILAANPSIGSHYHGHDKAPLLLVHGGYGSALCFIRWLPYLASQSRDVYSLSLSGHGLSPRPNNYVTADVADFAKDVESAINYIRSLHPENPPPVYIGHSAGGGLGQYVLENSPVEVSGAIFVAAFPPFGGWRVYLNWFLEDPFMLIRMLLHGGDPKSALSSTKLVQGRFFGPDMTKDWLEEFFEDMTPEESIGWPQSMMLTFVNPQKVKEKVKNRIHWIGGERDVLMSPNILQEAAARYQSGLTIIPRAGHHLPRDAHWKAGADAVLAKLNDWQL